jgi:competence protein ComEC
MALYFHRTSLTGLAANVFVVPATAIAVPAGLLALVTEWSPPVWVSAAALHFATLCVRTTAAIEPAWRIPDPPLWLSLGTTVSLIVFASWTRLRIAALVATVVLLALVLVHPFAPTVAPGALELTAIDVGQGESLLVSFPNGALMLVDAGGIPHFRRSARARMDIGEDVVSPYLWNRGIKRIDVLALTHSDEDHIGGLPAILRNFEVGELWIGNIPQADSWAEVEHEARRFGVVIRTPRQGETRSLGGAEIGILWPVRGTPVDTRRNNDNSLAMRIRYRSRTILLTGDIERNSEEALLAAGADIRSNVLKIAHHGSKTSTSDLWLREVKPAIAMISAGYENLYGHPHHDVTERLRHAGIAVLRTDQFGLLTVRTDGRGLEMEANAWQPGAWSTGRFWWAD